MRFLCAILVLLICSCGSTMSVMVIDTLEGGQFHVVGMGNEYSNVIKLPSGTKEGDIVKIKIEKDD